MTTNIFVDIKSEADKKTPILTLPLKVLPPEISTQKEQADRISTYSDKAEATVSTESPIIKTDIYRKDIIDEVSRAKANERKDVHPDELAFLTVLDFAGQEEFYDTHHIFLSEDGIYIFVFNLAEWIEGDSEDRIKGKSQNNSTKSVAYTVRPNVYVKKLYCVCLLYHKYIEPTRDH